jgi:hypothetical protein
MNTNRLARRWFLRECGLGFGSIALASLVPTAGRATTSSSHPLAPRRPHHAARAKRVVYIFQAGAPSHLDLFDYKPELAKRTGQLPPKELLKDYRAAFINPNSALLGPKFKFQRNGKSGIELSELLPGIGSVVDELCFIRSMQTDAVNHAPAQILMNTGHSQFGRPSLGAWVLYGLGSECENLPGYVVLSSAKGTSGGASNWGSGFLPTVFAGVPFRPTGDPILYLSNPKGYDRQTHRASLDTIERMNAQAFSEYGDPETAARIQSYELAARMQISAPELTDLTTESADSLRRYGIDDPSKPSFARNCLLARRLLERGVRFVQLFHEDWDHHGGLAAGLKRACRDTDVASAALVADLKTRGMLDDTLVIWGGEFGRTPMVQDGPDGRDHHNRGFTIWLAGAGIKGGLIYGATDDLGFNAVENPVHIHDLNATILHLLGFDHTRLTYRYLGRDFRLTDVHGNIVKPIIS